MEQSRLDNIYTLTALGTRDTEQETNKTQNDRKLKMMDSTKNLG